MPDQRRPEIDRELQIDYELMDRARAFMTKVFDPLIADPDESERDAELDRELRERYVSPVEVMEAPKADCPHCGMPVAILAPSVHNKGYRLVHAHDRHPSPSSSSEE